MNSTVIEKPVMSGVVLVEFDEPEMEFAETENLDASVDDGLSAAKSKKHVYAIGYAKNGIPVFPCEKNGKVPLTTHGFKDASTDFRQIDEWWIANPEANIGIPTGQISGFFVIDIDNKNGKNGSNSLREVEKKNGKLPGTLTIGTPSGGFHYYFKWKPGLKSSVDKLGNGIDTKGDGGYVIAGGSTIDGREYKLVNDVSIADLPEWLEQQLNPPRRSNYISVSQRRPENRTDAEKVLSALNSIDPDCSYEDWVRIGMALKSWDAEKGLELWDNWSSGGDKYKTGECESKWSTFKEDGGITVGTLFDMAHKKGWSWSPKAVISLTKPMLILPTTTATEMKHYRSFSECANEVSAVFSKELSLFVRGDVFVEAAEEKGSSGKASLILNAVDEEGFRSRLDNHFTPMVYRMSGKGDAAPRLMANNCSVDMAKALMAAREMKQGLPSITGVVRAPLLLKDGRVVRKGYDCDTGWFIGGGEAVEGVALETAVATLKSLVAGFNFQSSGDRSRALGSFFLPALRFGRFFERVPMDVAEADKSQSGKTYRQEVVAAEYGEETFKMSRRDGGVGGLDESFASRLFQGRAFIQFDNLREKLDSQYLEAYMTASGRTFGVRIPYHGEADIDPSGSCVFLSSNGVETTPDLANRSVIVRIRKQPEGFVYPTFDGLDLLEYVRENQGFVLGCVHSILKEWMSRGCPRTNESRHDFREWCQSMDWIIRNLFKEAPLMDGHQEAKERVSDPNKTFVRNICVLIEKLGRCGQEMKAGEIYIIAEDNDVKIPGLRTLTEDAGRKRIGTIMKSVGLKDSPVINIDGYSIGRTEESVKRSDGEGYFQMWSYRFSEHGKPVIPPAMKVTAVAAVTPYRV